MNSQTNFDTDSSYGHFLFSSFHGLLNHVFGQLKKIEKFLADARANVCSYLTTLSLVSHVIYNYGCH